MSKFFKKLFPLSKLKEDRLALDKFAQNLPLHRLNYRTMLFNTESSFPLEGVYLTFRNSHHKDWNESKAFFLVSPDGDYRFDAREGDEVLAHFQGDVERESILKIFHQLIYQTIHYSLEEVKTLFLNPPTETATYNEDKGLQWLQLNLKTLKDAILEVNQEPDKILQASFFLGEDPETLQHSFRLVIFNLDLFFFFTNGVGVPFLQVSAYDESQKQEDPIFQGSFNRYHREVLDEIIELLRTWTEAWFKNFQSPDSSDHSKH